MSDYAYTYDLRQDEAGFDTLTDAQRELGRAINKQARNGLDRRHLLFAAYGASACDKAALAEVWGGPGAGEEFLP